MKAPAKKRAVKKTPAKTKWEVFWIRTTDGTEYISEAKHLSNGIMLQDPTVITSQGTTMILAPYGLLAAEKSFFFPASTVIHSNKVTEPIENLYNASIASAQTYAQIYFDKLVDRSREILGNPEQEKSMSEKDVKEMDDMMNMLLGGGEEKISADSRSKKDMIDSLVELAEKAGKGKKT